jgi:hypothetical protein
MQIRARSSINLYKKNLLFTDKIILFQPDINSSPESRLEVKKYISLYYRLDKFISKRLVVIFFIIVTPRVNSLQTGVTIIHIRVIALNSQIQL